MKIDYTEFIARHHKVTQPIIIDVPQKKTYKGVISVLLLLLCIIILLIIATLTHLNELTRVVAGCSFALTGFVVLRVFSVHKKQGRDMALMSALLEGFHAARIITDSSDRIVYHNTKFERLCRGVGDPSYDTLVRLFKNNEDAMSHFNMLVDKAQRGLIGHIELFSKFEDRERWLMITAQQVSGYSDYIHWRIEDVTQKYTTDHAIKKEREKLIDFTDNAPVGFFSVNEHGRFLFANATFARWLGEDLQILLSQGYLHTYLVDPPKEGKPYDLINDYDQKQLVEVHMKGAAGKTFLASINQVIVHDGNDKIRTRAVVYDLTSEREMRKALQASEDRFQRFFEEAPLGIILVDSDGIIADCNHKFSSMLGFSIEEIEGEIFEKLVHKKDRKDVLFTLNLVERGELSETPLEIGLQANKDKQVKTHMYARRFKESGNVVLHFIDVTEKKALEEQFVQSQKMQAIGQLAGGIAHDFNNLLTAIIGFCDLLLLRHKPGDPSFSDIMQIKQNSNRASNLVRQLLAFSRQQTLRPHVQDITDILTELSHLIRRLIGSNIDLQLIHGQELGLVKVDEGQMDQVFINLAVNARDAMDGGGGYLTVETKNFTCRKPKELISEELPAGHWILIKVTDTGCGISKKNMSRIFEPFFTTKKVGEGTGLGLATVYGIVRQTGGYLDVKSKIKEGTSFYIYLPRATELEEEEIEEVVVEEISSKDLTGTERILLVEDEDAVRTFSQRALSNKGYEVLTAESGEAALAVIEAQDNKHFDLLITDVVMPNMDGPTLVKRIRKDIGEPKIIFISGYTEDKLKDHMGENVYFLPKPFTLKQLAAKVKKVLNN